MALQTPYLWERACSRRGRHIQDICRLNQRFREQARSHRGLCVCSKPRRTGGASHRQAAGWPVYSGAINAFSRISP
ncbi:hypothetical protein C2E19_28795 [Pseudomonas sp. DTU12.3]|nr:hypothetical protein C2E19_28795 [Pseudomonas sp. DTU12.3]